MKGPLTIPPAASNSYVEIRGTRFTSANQALRKIFSLYANIRPALHTEGVKVPFPGVDLGQSVSALLWFVTVRFEDQIRGDGLNDMHSRHDMA